MGKWKIEKNSCRETGIPNILATREIREAKGDNKENSNQLEK